MGVLRFLHARRLVLCLGLLAFASGCGDQDPVAAVSKDEGKQRGESQQKAREAQYGPGGVPKGKPAAQKDAPQKSPDEKSPESK